MFISQAELTCFITFSSVISISCIDSIRSCSKLLLPLRSIQARKTVLGPENVSKPFFVIPIIAQTYIFLQGFINYMLGYCYLLSTTLTHFHSFFFFFFFSPSPLVYLVLCVLILDLLLTRIYLIVD